MYIDIYTYLFSCSMHTWTDKYAGNIIFIILYYIIFSYTAQIRWRLATTFYKTKLAFDTITSIGIISLESRIQSFLHPCSYTNI